MMMRTMNTSALVELNPAQVSPAMAASIGWERIVRLVDQSKMQDSGLWLTPIQLPTKKSLSSSSQALSLSTSSPSLLIA